MWSLPDLTRMNAVAASDTTKAAIAAAVETGKLAGKPVPCECAYDEKCCGPIRVEKWYDIFSDDPKGVIGLCEHHDENFGPAPEGYFVCEDCGRLHTENYTWERYEKNGRCLVCAAREHLTDEKNWIDLVGTDNAVRERITAATDFERVRKAPHILANSLDPARVGLAFVVNTEFDGMDGHCISGSGCAGLAVKLLELRASGTKRAVIILDTAWQFAVSIGLYVDAPKPAAGKKAKKARAAEVRS